MLGELLKSVAQLLWSIYSSASLPMGRSCSHRIFKFQRAQIGSDIGKGSGSKKVLYSEPAASFLATRGF